MKIKKYDFPKGSLISYMSNMVKKYGGINLAQGIPGFAPPRELLEILSKTASENVHQYAPGTGNHDLVNLLISHYRKYNTTLNDHNILMVNGATEAISLIYIYLKNILDENFSVLSFDPVYESYKYLPGIFHNEFVPYYYHDDQQINFDELDTIIKKKNVKIIFVASPGNPYGRIWSKEELMKLSQICNHNKCYIVFDAVYKDLYFDEEPFQPVNLINENVFYVNSFSKMLSVTGWRIGYLLCNKAHMEKIRYIHDYTGLCVPSVLQVAVAKYLNEYDFAKTYLSTLRKRIFTNFQMLSGALKENQFTIPTAKGGYFVWAQLPENYPDGFNWAMNLYDQYKVAVIPGIHFSGKGDRFARFNIAREYQEIKEAINRVNRFCKSL